MRIGIDIRVLMEDRLTGVEIYTLNLVQSLISIDNTNKYILFSSGRKRPPAHACFKAPNVSHYHLNFPNRLFNLSLWALGRPQLDKLIGGVDVFFSPRHLFGSVSPRSAYVASVHDLSFVRNPDFFSWPRRLWHRLVDDLGACRNSTRIIAVSESTKRDLVELYSLPDQKISVIYPGVDKNIFYPDDYDRDDAVVVESLGLPERYLLYLGTFEPRKNIPSIIAGYELASKSAVLPPLVLAGRLGWLYQSILNRINRSPNNERIKVLQDVSETLKPALYRRATALIFPSWYEGFGFPPLEAMACGTPVIASYNSSFPEVLGNACLYVNPFDSLQIADALKGILTDEKLRNRLRGEGLKQAQKFDWQISAKKTLEVFQNTRIK